MAFVTCKWCCAPAVVAILAGLSIASPTALGAASYAMPARARSCPSFTLSGYVFAVKIEKGGVTCSTARKVLRAFLSGRGKLHGPPNGPAYKQTWTLYGWSCGHGAGGGGCIRHGSNYKNARDYILAEIRS